MKRWIRWQGVVAFVAVSAVLIVIWWLVVDRVIRYGIEKAGSKIVGAKVELAKADLTLFPLGLTLNRLQVTNPEQPMTNALEVFRITGALDALNLLHRKVIVEEMAVDGIRFNTPRKTSGALSEHPVRKTDAGTGSAFKLPDVSLRDPKAILAGENLQSLKLIDELKRDIEAEKQRWQKNLSELPDQARLKDYQQRMEGLKSAGQGGIGGIAGGIGEAVKLREDLKRDLDRLQGAKQDLERSTSALRKRSEEVAQAPSADVKRLLDKYSLSASGLANLSAALLGGKIGDWLRTALLWHAKLQPMLARSSSSEHPKGAEVVKPIRGKGVDVRFKEHRPLPDFLVRLARVSVELPAGTLRGEVHNITPDQPILGAPLTFRFAGEKFQGLGAVALDGEVNRLNPEKPSDRIALRATEARLTDYALGDPAGAGLIMKQATADIDVRAALTGKAITATLISRLQSVQMATAGVRPDAGPVAAAVSGALGGIKGFQVRAEVSGTRETYSISLTSDLDQVLKKAVGAQVQGQLDQFQRNLQSAVMEKVKGPLGSLGTDLGGLDGIGRELAGRLNLGNDLLKTGAGGKSGFKLPF